MMRHTGSPPAGKRDNRLRQVTAIACVTVALFVTGSRPCPGVQPAFIQGTIYNAFNNAVVRTAVIQTATGLETTTSVGRFSVRVPPNMYSLCVSAPGFRTNVLAGVVASPGKTATVDVWLFPTSSTAARLAGRVTSTVSRDALAGVFVTTDLGGVAVTDEDGYFDMTTPSGTATVTAFGEGLRTTRIGNVHIAASSTHQLTITMGEAPEEQVRLLAYIANACSATGISNARVFSSAGDLGVSSAGLVEVAIPTGTSTALVTAEGYLFSPLTLTVGPLRQVVLRSVWLLPARKGCGMISGVITDAVTDLPVSDATVISDTVGITTTDRSGHYSLYTSICTTQLHVSRSGYEPADIETAAVYGTSLTSDIVLWPLGTVSGIVSDATDNHTISGAVITIDGNPLQTTTSNTAGTFEFTDLRPGTYRVDVLHRCYSPVERDLTITSGQTISVPVRLEAPARGTLAGTVTDALSGAGIAGAQVRADHGAAGLTDAAGYYTLELPSCDTGLYCSAPGYLCRSLPVCDIRDDATTTRDIALVPCPAAVALTGHGVSDSSDREDMLVRLRALRDLVLHRHPWLRPCLATFYRHAADLSRILRCNPLLRRECADLLRRIAASVPAGTDLIRDTHIPDWIDRVQALLQAVDAKADSPRLHAALQQLMVSVRTFTFTPTMNH